MSGHDNLVAQVFGAGKRIDREGDAFVRRAVLVCQYPLSVHIVNLNDGLLAPGSDARRLLLRTTLVALNQVKLGETDDQNTEHWVVREDCELFDYQPARVAEEQLGPWGNKTVLSPDVFDDYATMFMSGLSNTEKLREFIKMTEEVAPAMQIAPKRVHELLHRKGYEFLPRYFARHNLDNYDCLVWIESKNQQLPKARLQALRIDDEIKHKHLGGGWYAFQSIEDAMALKLLANNTEVHPIHE